MSDIKWHMTGSEVEAESFRRIEEEMPEHDFPPELWRIIRRMIHTTADFSIADHIHFANEPVKACLKALSEGAPIYSDSNMIKSGISVPKLKMFNPVYERDSIHCYIADADVANAAKENKSTRALAALKKAEPILNDAIVLIGNAPLALAGLARLIAENDICPRLVIGMPVGFVHVTESKEMIMTTDVPQIVLKGRRGGSPLAVSALHAMMEK